MTEVDLSAGHSVVALNAELLVHVTDQPMQCLSGVATWEPVDARQNLRFGSVLCVRRCTLPPGHEGAHTPQDPRTRPPRRHATRCGFAVDDQTWIAWEPTDGDPLCSACHGLADDGEQEALAI